MPPLFKPERIAIRAVGSTVEVVIGNTTLTFAYDDALTLSRWLRVRGKEAKRNAGDRSRHWTAVGDLTTLEALREQEKQFWS